MRYKQLPTLISSVLIVMSVSAYGQEEPLSPEEVEKFISINAQDIVDAGEDRAALRRQFDQKLKQLREENQQLKATVDNLVTALKTQMDTQQQQIAALETENQRLANLVRSSQRQIDSQQQRVAALEKKEKKRFDALRYIDNGDGTVTDKDSRLIWLKNANCFGEQKWQWAMQRANNLKSGQCGLRDGSTAGMWRLPTRDEWVRMMDKRYKPALSNATGTAKWTEGHVFSGVRADYWTSTKAADGSEAWYVNLYNGGIYTAEKAGTYFVATEYVWPVRRRQ